MFLINIFLYYLIQIINLTLNFLKQQILISINNNRKYLNFFKILIFLNFQF